MMSSSAYLSILCLIATASLTHCGKKSKANEVKKPAPTVEDSRQKEEPSKPGETVEVVDEVQPAPQEPEPAPEEPQPRPQEPEVTPSPVPTPLPVTMSDLVGEYEFGEEFTDSYKEIRIRTFSPGEFYFNFSDERSNSSNEGPIEMKAQQLDIFIMGGSCGGAGCRIPFESMRHYPCSFTLKGEKPNRALTLSCSGAGILNETYKERN